MTKKDKLTEEIFTELNKNVQFDLDTIMAHLIANKPTLARDKSIELQKKVEYLNHLLNELEKESRIDLSN